MIWEEGEKKTFKKVLVEWKKVFTFATRNERKERAKRLVLKEFLK